MILLLHPCTYVDKAVDPHARVPCVHPTRAQQRRCCTCWHGERRPDLAGTDDLGKSQSHRKVSFVLQINTDNCEQGMLNRKSDSLLFTDFSASSVAIRGQSPFYATPEAASIAA